MSSEIIKTRIAEISKIGEHLIFLKLADGVDIAMKDLHETSKVQIELMAGQKFYSIIDCRNISVTEIPIRSIVTGRCVMEIYGVWLTSCRVARCKRRKRSRINNYLLRQFII